MLSTQQQDAKYNTMYVHMYMNTAYSVDGVSFKRVPIVFKLIRKQRSTQQTCTGNRTIYVF